MMYLTWITTCVVLVGRETLTCVRRTEPGGSILPDRDGSGPSFFGTWGSLVHSKVDRTDKKAWCDVISYYHEIRWTPCERKVVISVLHSKTSSLCEKTPSKPSSDSAVWDRHVLRGQALKKRNRCIPLYHSIAGLPNLRPLPLESLATFPS